LIEYPSDNNVKMFLFHSLFGKRKKVWKNKTDTFWFYLIRKSYDTMTFVGKSTLSINEVVGVFNLCFNFRATVTYLGLA